MIKKDRLWYLVTTVDKSNVFVTQVIKIWRGLHSTSGWLSWTQTCHGITRKPFAGINGSGKHANWSIGTDTGLNFFYPGKNEVQIATVTVWWMFNHLVSSYPQLLPFGEASKFFHQVLWYSSHHMPSFQTHLRWSLFSRTFVHICFLLVCPSPLVGSSQAGAKLYVTAIACLSYGAWDDCHTILASKKLGWYLQQKWDQIGNVSNFGTRHPSWYKLS